MSLVTAALLGALALLSIAAFRARGDRFWAALGLICGVGLALVLIQNGVDTSASPTIPDALLAATGGVAAAEAFGLPRWLAARLGIGLRSREWEFDRTLTDLLRPLNRRLEARPVEVQPTALGNWRSGVVKDGRATLARLAQLTPPNEEWGAMAATYAEVYGALLDAVNNESHDAFAPSIGTLTHAANLERERLRESYRAESERLIQSSRLARLLRTHRKRS